MISKVYHGTNEYAAEMILIEGFKADSWFAVHLEDAICFGGDYVFEVALEWDEKSDEDWQFHVLEPIPAKKIIKLQKYNIETIFLQGSD